MHPPTPPPLKKTQDSIHQDWYPRFAGWKEQQNTMNLRCCFFVVLLLYSFGPIWWLYSVFGQPNLICKYFVIENSCKSLHFGYVFVFCWGCCWLLVLCPRFWTSTTDFQDFWIKNSSTVLHFEGLCFLLFPSFGHFLSSKFSGFGGSGFGAKFWSNIYGIC